MKFQIIGGDLRSVELAKLLGDAGNEVTCFALDKAEGIEKSSEIENADCYILPLPAEGKMAGKLNAPLAAGLPSMRQSVMTAAPRESGARGAKDSSVTPSIYPRSTQ